MKWKRIRDHIDDNAHTENKLKKPKPRIIPWKSIPDSRRKNEVKIARLRFGRTRLTHRHYMSRGRPPECTYWGMTRLTTDHFLMNYQIIRPLRNQLKLPNDLQKLLGEECPVAPLIKYLDKIGVLDKL